MTEFEQNLKNEFVGLSASLQVGLGHDQLFPGAQTKAIVQEGWDEPNEYEHLSFEEKLHLADVMIARWNEYRDRIISEETIPHEA